MKSQRIREAFTKIVKEEEDVWGLPPIKVEKKKKFKPKPVPQPRPPLTSKPIEKKKFQRDPREPHWSQD